MSAPRPTPIDIARELAGVVGFSGSQRGELDSFERDVCQSIYELLDQEPPQVASAFDEAQRGVEHAWRADFHEDGRVEAWVCAAVAELLRGQSQGGAA